MTTQRQKGFEYEHIEIPQSWVNAALRQYGMFHWELVGTQTVVSKESHIERGKGLFDSDTIYSVTTTERFATVDLKRDLNITNLDKIKAVESQYFDTCNRLIGIGCSPVNEYGPPPKKSIGLVGLLLYCFYIVPGILYSKKINGDNEKTANTYKELKGRLSRLMRFSE